MDIQRFLQDYIARTGHSQAEIARILGATRSQVNHWIKGKYKPSRLRIDLIMQRLGSQA